MNPACVLVTGSSGYLGSQVVAALAARGDIEVIALDLRDPAQRLPGVIYESADIRAAEVDAIVGRHRPRVVVHLASIVTPGKKSNREFEFSVDVGGTRNLLEACLAHGVRRIIVSSSGAAYGYHADNPEWLSEADPVRGNQSFAYSWHKRLVEEMLAEYRASQPQLEQIVFRIGTILGATVHNQITDLFEKPRLIAIKGSDSPFVFIHDQDVVGAIVQGVDSTVTGIFNVAGDGKLSIFEIAERLGKRCVVLQPGLLQAALWLLKKLGMTRYGPEQIDFLRYRPVLANRCLKEEFGYVPKLTSAEVFDLWRRSRQGKAR
ncbi:SDR family oxidoreductase [Sulfuritalea sp.]|uniref:SDR family oxidoreductase n=1 Tax=Sulfuritalea sp. TaxID=2480090 RepID=UPI001AD180BB|nr:SDR family oxidoreductase [Sulfuritalea sp.]MBN8475228.1 SDR family oxidoreductase [Sulfuritalea sp.]